MVSKLPSGFVGAGTPGAERKESLGRGKSNRRGNSYTLLRFLSLSSSFPSAVSLHFSRACSTLSSFLLWLPIEGRGCPDTKVGQGLPSGSVGGGAVPPEPGSVGYGAPLGYVGTGDPLQAKKSQRKVGGGGVWFEKEKEKNNKGTNR